VKLATTSEALFSAKSFAAAMLSVYIAMRIGLPRPFWAMMTSYIVAAPFSGPTRSKAVYRAAGTVLGAVAVTFMVPQLANAPELLSLALSLWIAACLYVSLLDRTPRAYALMLAGYTAGLVAFPAVNDPGSIFDVALARVEEIVLGIVCATLIHSIILPQSFAPVLLARLDKALGDARQWIADALAPGGGSHGAQDRRKLAGDITELRLMATHLPFDTSHLRWTANAIHALQERLAAMMPLLSAVEDRLLALRQLGALEESSRWRTVLADITAWTGGPRDQAEPGREDVLRREIDALTPQVTRDAGWRALVEVNLAARLHALVDACAQASTLRRHIDAGVHGELPQEARKLPGVPARALHRDHGQALVSALSAAIATLACCAFWILTGWPAGSAAPMMAAVMCCFFATQDDPVPMINGFTKYTVYSIPLSALYILGILPAVHNYETFMLACAPVCLAMGVAMGRPATFPKAMPFLFGFCGTLALQESHSADLVSFTNGTLSQVGGLMVAAVTTRVLRTFSAGWTARRLLKAGWRELARMGSGERVPSPAEFSARMVDRIALLTPRLALARGQQDLQAADALVDLRIGLNMAQLQSVRGQLGRAEAALWPLLEHLARHFEARPAVDAAGEERLLASLDNALRAVCAAADGPARQQAVAALAGTRRDLFPGAAPYAPAPILEKEIR
jgi:uncharacterized membrane protein YccC